MHLGEQQSAFIPVKPIKLKQQQKPVWLHEKWSQTQRSLSNGRVEELRKQPELSKKRTIRTAKKNKDWHVKT